MLFDLHVHTHYSPCGSVSTAEIIEAASRLGLDGVCLTDHDTMEAAEDILEGVQPCGLCVIIGMEYTTTEGDILIFGPLDDLREGLEARELLEIVEDRGGAAIAAHPFREARSIHPKILEDSRLRIVEYENGRNTEQENLLCRQWSSRRPELVKTVGSDAHTLEELGRCRTLIHDEIRSRQDLIRALRSGRCEPFPSDGRLSAAG